MPYQVRAKRRDDGNYDLSYGKGRQKLTAVAIKDPANDRWFVDVVGHWKLIRDVKEKWGKWAEGRYNGRSKATGESIPAVPARIIPPPPVARIKPTQFDCPGVDKNDPRFYYPANHPEPRKRGKITPLGMLFELQDWYTRYKGRVDDINQELAMRKMPGFNPFSFLQAMLDECIAIELPQENIDGN